MQTPKVKTVKYGLKKLDPFYHTVFILNHLGVDHKCDRQTDRRTDRDILIANAMLNYGEWPKTPTNINS